MQKEEREKVISSAALRILVGGLLVYYAYALATDLDGSWETKQIVLLVFGILFLIVGIVFAASGIVNLVKLFKQGNLLPESQEETTDQEKKEVSKSTTNTGDKETDC